MEVAFDQAYVQIDFLGYTAETLHTAIQEPLDKIPNGLLTPESFRLRLLLSDLTVPMAIPSRAGDDPGDVPRVRARIEQTAQWGSTRSRLLRSPPLGDPRERRRTPTSLRSLFMPYCTAAQR
jgi:hypothetical protein